MRWIHKLYAKTFGYFWLPCPICGSFFGGHEATSACVWVKPYLGECVCRDCEAEAMRINHETDFGAAPNSASRIVEINATRGRRTSP